VFWKYGGDSKQFPSLLLEGFARPAQGPRIDVPPSAAVSRSLSGIKCRADKVLCMTVHVGSLQRELYACRPSEPLAAFQEQRRDNHRDVLPFRMIFQTLKSKSLN
jgi:hypothetical protein